VREGFEVDIDWYAGDVSEDYDEFLLRLEADTIDDETFLHVCRETESYDYLVERLLKLGRLEEALTEAKQVENYDILEIADILCEHGHEAAAERLIEERVKEYDDTNLLQWLKEREQNRNLPALRDELAKAKL
jgi:heme oxygenase